MSCEGGLPPQTIVAALSWPQTIALFRTADVSNPEDLSE